MSGSASWQRVDADNRTWRLSCGRRKAPQLDDEIPVGPGYAGRLQRRVEQGVVAFPALVNPNHDQAACQVLAALSQPVDRDRVVGRTFSE
jgi:hypothetical protein